MGGYGVGMGAPDLARVVGAQVQSVLEERARVARDEEAREQQRRDAAELAELRRDKREADEAVLRERARVLQASRVQGTLRPWFSALSV